MYLRKCGGIHTRILHMCRHEACVPPIRWPAAHQEPLLPINPMPLPVLPTGPLPELALLQGWLQAASLQCPAQSPAATQESHKCLQGPVKSALAAAAAAALHILNIHSSSSSRFACSVCTLQHQVAALLAWLEMSMLSWCRASPTLTQHKLTASKMCTTPLQAGISAPITLAGLPTSGTIASLPSARDT